MNDLKKDRTRIQKKEVLDDIIKYLEKLKNKYTNPETITWDRLLNMVPLYEVSKKLNLPYSTIRKYALHIKKNKLLKVKYE